MPHTHTYAHMVRNCPWAIPSMLIDGYTEKLGVQPGLQTQPHSLHVLGEQGIWLLAHWPTAWNAHGCWEQAGWGPSLQGIRVGSILAENLANIHPMFPAFWLPSPAHPTGILPSSHQLPSLRS